MARPERRNTGHSRTRFARRSRQRRDVPHFAPDKPTTEPPVNRQQPLHPHHNLKHPGVAVRVAAPRGPAAGQAVRRRENADSDGPGVGQAGDRRSWGILVVRFLGEWADFGHVAFFRRATWRARRARYGSAIAEV